MLIFNIIFLLKSSLIIRDL